MTMEMITISRQMKMRIHLQLGLMKILMKENRIVMMRKIVSKNQKGHLYIINKVST